jgi:hypothetical protein
MNEFLKYHKRSEAIELWYTVNGTEFKQGFERLAEALKEVNRLIGNEVQFSLWVVGDANWDYRVTNERGDVEVFYIARPETTCESGYFGTIGHFRSVMAKVGMLNRKELIDVY